MIGIRPDANLTGGQIQQILDKLLYDSINLIIPTGIINPVLVTILSSLILDKRRKISSADYNTSINLLCNLVLKNSTDSFDDLRQLKLERTTYIKIIHGVIKQVEDSNYINLYSEWLIRRSESKDTNDLHCKMLKVEKTIGISRDKLFMLYQNIQYNQAVFMEFKSSVLSQFINLAHKYTSTQIKHRTKNTNYDDLFQNIVTAISKALDKYDSSKGALTSYIKYWIVNAQNQDNSHTDGLAYEITHTQRQKLARKESSEKNFSSSSLAVTDYMLSECSSPEVLVEEKDSFNRILNLVKIADINGLFRLINNIEEFITTDELLKMKKHMSSEIERKKAVKVKATKVIVKANASI